MELRSRLRGFTLIELLVVIAIIGILAAIVTTQLAGAQVKARNTRAQNDISEMSKGMSLFMADDNNASNAVITAFSAAAATPASNTVGGASAVTCAASPTYDAANAICYMFRGSQNTSAGSLQYGTHLGGTQGGYTYTYTSGNGSNGNTAVFAATTPTQYIIGTNTVAVGSTAAGYSWVQNGASSSGASLPTTP